MGLTTTSSFIGGGVGGGRSIYSISTQSLSSDSWCLLLLHHYLETRQVPDPLVERIPSVLADSLGLAPGPVEPGPRVPLGSCQKRQDHHQEDVTLHHSSAGDCSQWLSLITAADFFKLFSDSFYCMETEFQLFANNLQSESKQNFCKVIKQITWQYYK